MGQCRITERGHIPFLDSIRVAACFLVILLHVSAINFYSFGPAWSICVVYDSIARMCVPLFFMLSGFLLLDSDISSLTKFYYRRYLRILVPFFVICVMYYFTGEYSQLSVGEYIYFILHNYVDYHLWYIYTIAGLYLALPFFIKMIHGPSGLKLACLYAVIWLAAFVICTPLLRYFRFENDMLPHFNYLLPNGGMEYLAYELYPNAFFNFNLDWFFFGFMGYLLLGWFVKKTYQRYTKPLYIICMLICAGATFMIAWVTHRYSYALARPNELFFENLSPFVFLQALSFFMACSAFARPGLAGLADKTFWIYLIHLLWLRMIAGLWPLPQSMWAIIAIPLMAAAVFGLSWLAAIPLRALEKRLLALLAWH